MGEETEVRLDRKSLLIKQLSCIQAQAYLNPRAVFFLLYHITSLL